MTDNKIAVYMRSQPVMERFAEMVGNNNAMHYIGSVLLAVANSTALQECTPQSIYTAAMQAAVLHLSCDPNIGHAYLVPYGKKAKLIVGYKGLHSLAVSTGQYRYINVGKIYEGEALEEDRISGFMKLTGGKTSNTVIGYVGAFEMTNGYSKTIYMSVEEIHEHAQRYSQSYTRADSAWKTATAEMEKKTVLRQLLRKWGILDPTTEKLLDEVDDRNNEISKTTMIIDVPPEVEDNTPEPEPISESQAMSDLGFDSEPETATPPMEFVDDQTPQPAAETEKTKKRSTKTDADPRITALIEAKVVRDAVEATAVLAKINIKASVPVDEVVKIVRGFNGWIESTGCSDEQAIALLRKGDYPK